MTRMQEIYLDREKTKPFTDYKMDEDGYAILEKGKFFIFGNSKVILKNKTIAWIFGNSDVILKDKTIAYTFDKVKVYARGDSRVHSRGQSEVWYRENAIIC